MYLLQQSGNKSWIASDQYRAEAWQKKVRSAMLSDSSAWLTASLNG
jgi:hypothetical protein